MANAIVGTLILIGAASLFGLPIGIGAGLYLAEKRGTLESSLRRWVAALREFRLLEKIEGPAISHTAEHMLSDNNMMLADRKLMTVITDLR